MKTLITLIISILVTSAAAAQHEGHHQHKSHMDILVTEYLEAKNALVTDDFEIAKNHLTKFSEEVKSSSEMNHHEQHSEKHEMHHTAMLEAVDNAAEAENLKELRAAFADISAELIKAVENQGYDEELFVQFCPMEKGGYWLNEDEEIENPYLGSSMSTCGNVEKVIE